MERRPGAVIPSRSDHAATVRTHAAHHPKRPHGSVSTPHATHMHSTSTPLGSTDTQCVAGVHTVVPSAVP